MKKSMVRNSSLILATLIVLLFVGTGCPVDPGDVSSMTGTVSITGTARYSEELTTVPSLTNGGTVTYQWQRDSVDIVGATSSTYTLVEDDIGSKITVVATADGIAGTGSITSDETATVAKATGPGAPSEAIVGVFPAAATTIELSSFSASATGLEAAVAIDGSTYASYADVSVDGDGEATITSLTGVTTSTKVRIRVKETTTTLAGSDKEISVTAKIPEMTGSVSISGTARYGEELTAVPNLTNGGTVTYQWQRDSVDIVGAKSSSYTLVKEPISRIAIPPSNPASTYTLVEDDIGSKITVVATADGIAGTGSITSDETATVAKATGPGAPSETIVGVFPAEATSIELSALAASATGLEAAVAIDGTSYGNYADLNVDSNGEAEITNLTGVSESTKVSIRVKETTTTLAGSVKEITVTAKIPEMTGTVSITGTARYGEELTAVPNLTNGGTVTYQWQRNSVDIVGATSSSYTLVKEPISRMIPPSTPASTYTLVEDDIGSKITVVVTADGIAGTGSITSEETDTVAKATGPSAPSETIVGVFPAEATSIELSALAASATGLEAAVAIDGTSYGNYADLNVDSNGEAEITNLTGVSESTKVSIRVKETTTTLAGSVKEITVTAKIPEMTGTVSITGTARYGEELTAVPNLTNGGTVTYQWQRNSVDIVGATSSSYTIVKEPISRMIPPSTPASTYTLVEDDIDSKITVVATADGIAGTGSITSDPTDTVAKAASPSAPSETIVGVFPSTTDSIELSGFSVSATGLEAAVAIDGTSYGNYADLNVDSNGEAEITSLTGVTTSTKVRIRVKETTTTLAGSDKEITVTEKTASYAVGDLGPSGGRIFYDDSIGFDLDGNSTIESTEKDLLDGTNDGTVSGDRYLEAAPSDIMLGTDDFTHIFGYYRLSSGGASTLVGTSTSVGTGEVNTADLVSKMGSTAYISSNLSTTTTTEDYAARLCALHVVGEYSDWFLPSKDELDVMYDNLKVNSLGSFSGVYYWSSSEYNGNNAWLQYFGNGIQNNLNKDIARRVRPVRAF